MTLRPQSLHPLFSTSGRAVAATALLMFGLAACGQNREPASAPAAEVPAAEVPAATAAPTAPTAAVDPQTATREQRIDATARSIENQLNAQLEAQADKKDAAARH